MKLLPLSAEQADFIWSRAGTVYVMYQSVRYGELPRPYNGGDFVERVPGFAERRVINQFKRRDDYPEE